MTILLCCLGIRDLVLSMQAVYIVDDAKIASVLIDPMRRAILNLLRQKPMTQAQLTNELGLSGASLNHHVKILRSKKLVSIARREIERHRIMQIFFSSVAYLFVYDLNLLPKNISRYFYPVSLERGATRYGLINPRIIRQLKKMVDFSAPPVVYWSERIAEGLDLIDNTLMEFEEKEKKNEINIIRIDDEAYIVVSYKR